MFKHRLAVPKPRRGGAFLGENSKRSSPGSNMHPNIAPRLSRERPTETTFHLSVMNLVFASKIRMMRAKTVAIKAATN